MLNPKPSQSCRLRGHQILAQVEGRHSDCRASNMVLLLMIETLQYPKDLKLWELWHIPYDYG